MIDFIKTLHPRFWIMLCPYNKNWDEAINAALDTGDIERISRHKAVISCIQVWVENYPYNYGTPYKAINVPYKLQVRPSRKTILRIRNMVPSEYVKEVDERVKEWLK